MDITKEIKAWKDGGDQLIVLTDFNDNVTNPSVSSWASNLGLVEAITWLLPESAPPTYQRGSKPIDGIFIAPQILTLALGGYLSFGDAIPSDHQVIWLDLHLPEVCPPQPESHIKPQVCWLQCKDPCIVAQYNTVLLEILKNHNIPQQILQLQTQLQKPSDL